MMVDLLHLLHLSMGTRTFCSSMICLIGWFHRSSALSCHSHSIFIAAAWFAICRTSTIIKGQVPVLTRVRYITGSTSSARSLSMLVATTASSSAFEVWAQHHFVMSLMCFCFSSVSSSILPTSSSIDLLFQRDLVLLYQFLDPCTGFFYLLYVF